MSRVSLIATIGTFGQIGLDGKIPWLHLPEFADHVADAQKRFDEMTTGGVLIMGQKTFDSYVSGSPAGLGRAVHVWKDERYVSPEAMLALVCKKYPDREIWICGGAHVFEKFTPYCDWHIISQVPYHGAADKYLPPLIPAWKVVERGEFGSINTYVQSTAIPLGCLLLQRHGFPVWVGPMNEVPEEEFLARDTVGFIHPQTYERVARAAMEASKEGTIQ